MIQSPRLISLSSCSVHSSLPLPTFSPQHRATRARRSVERYVRVASPVKSSTPEAGASAVLEGQTSPVVAPRTGSMIHATKDGMLTVYQSRYATLYNPIRPSTLNDRTICLPNRALLSVQTGCAHTNITFFPPEADDSRHVLRNKVKLLHIARQSYIHRTFLPV
jgi:hypothetical protein